MQTASKRKDRREIVVKLQTVRVVPLTLGDGDMSLGQSIDSMLHTAAMENTIPNKLVIDLYPPRVRDDGDLREED